MSRFSQYGNYDLYPETKIEGFDTSAWEGKETIVSELKQKIQLLLKEKQRIIVCFDCYPGVDKEEILSLAKQCNPVKIFDTEDYAKSEETLNEEFHDYMTEDRVFGIMCHKKLEDFFL